MQRRLPPELLLLHAREDALQRQLSPAPAVLRDLADQNIDQGRGRGLGNADPPVPDLHRVAPALQLLQDLALAPLDHVHQLFEGVTNDGILAAGLARSTQVAVVPRPQELVEHLEVGGDLLNLPVLAHYGAHLQAPRRRAPGARARHLRHGARGPPGRPHRVPFRAPLRGLEALGVAVLDEEDRVGSLHHPHREGLVHRAQHDLLVGLARLYHGTALLEAAKHLVRTDLEQFDPLRLLLLEGERERLVLGPHAGRLLSLLRSALRFPLHRKD
mmetsp:Transcript_10527/g.29747  ORF Transcript_10527/g.29747 Transcript_10527/m.29747 type:complete len:272 (+) Transcript_10527:506-1321(+)